MCVNFGVKVVLYSFLPTKLKQALPESWSIKQYLTDKAISKEQDAARVIPHTVLQEKENIASIQKGVILVTKGNHSTMHEISLLAYSLIKLWSWSMWITTLLFCSKLKDFKGWMIPLWKSSFKHEQHERRELDDHTEIEYKWQMYLSAWMLFSLSCPSWLSWHHDNISLTTSSIAVWEIWTARATLTGEKFPKNFSNYFLWDQLKVQIHE